MRKAKLLSGVAAFSLLAGSIATGASVASSAAGAAAVQPHIVWPHTTYPVYNTALVNTKQREIWPYVDPSFFTVTNVSRTQQPMYRPLYWIGLGNSIVVQPTLSIGNLPVFSNGNKTVKITLKTWKWSNGETVTAKDVAFWLNLAKAEPTGYGGYSPGVGIPDQVKSTVVSGQTITINLKSATNPNWFLYNALATVTPMPMAWDAKALGLAGTNCSDLAFANVPVDNGSAPGNASPCAKVYNYFTNLQMGVAYRSHNMDSVFQVVDGPYHLTAYNYASDSTYNVTLSPNPLYSGPVKAKVAVRFRWYGTLAAEVIALEQGNVLQGGALSPDLVTAKPAKGVVGTVTDPSIKPNYNATSGNFWGFDYAYINFNGHATDQALLRQQYIRQALEESINQAGLISSVYNGYAVANCSPLPVAADPYLKTPYCPFKYNLFAAKTLLINHGWDTTTTPATCIRPGTAANQCGAGIGNGAQLSLNYEYVTGGNTAPEDIQMGFEVSNWAKIGIQINLNPQGDAQVQTDCLSTDPSATFDICQYGGWVYSPGAYPSGEQLFLPGSASNTGFVNNATLTADIKATDFTATPLTAYNNFAANYIPVLYQPSSLGVGALKKSVKGAQAPNPISDFNPEYISAV